MENLSSYLTKDGWRKDLEKTQENLSSLLMPSTGLTGIVNKEQGNIASGILFVAIASPICAYLGSYLGEGFGWLNGNLVDLIPIIRDVAPWMAERSGLIENVNNVPNLNENLYQTTGAIAGFWGGLALPIKVLTSYLKDN